MEEIIQELLEKAKQNGSQASVILTEIQELLNGENPQIQDLLERAKQNGTQASVVLLEIEEILYGEEENLEEAKQNGSQSTTILVDLAENRPLGPIPVEGDVQIFADPECTQYATGSERTVYVRVNTPWGFNGGWFTGEEASNNFFAAAAPSSEYPDDPYNIIVWQSWGCPDSSVPYTAGQVVECTYMDEELIPVSNPTVIFSNPTIPAEGDIQIFADPECTQYATGVVDKVYARINRPFGFDEAAEIAIDGDGNNSVHLNGPTSREVDSPYSIACYVDFISEEQNYPFTAGQVVECIIEDPYDVTDFGKVFTYAPEFVDLGLPSGTKWANSNLGAGLEQNYGKYFSWGNIDGVTSVDTEGIAAMTQAAYEQTKGATLTGDIPATAEYDAAVARFQGIVDCQIPTQTQLQELVDECTWTWQADYISTGIKGYLVTSKTNGNSIFLPAARQIYDGTYSEKNQGCSYWTNIESTPYAYSLYGEIARIEPANEDQKFCGLSIRPVQNS